MKTIFISGIHGVGKSYICGIINKELGISHYSASSLIREYREDLVAANKAVQNIKVNQSALVEQYHKLKDENLIIMDGHTCLLKDGLQSERIPMAVFEALDICALVYVSAPVETIVERIKKRDGILHDTNRIEELLNDECSYCQEIAKHLSVPMICIESDCAGISQVFEFVKQFVG